MVNSLLYFIFQMCIESLFIAMYLFNLFDLYRNFAQLNIKIVENIQKMCFLQGILIKYSQFHYKNTSEMLNPVTIG